MRAGSIARSWLPACCGPLVLAIVAAVPAARAEKLTLNDPTSPPFAYPGGKGFLPQVLREAFGHCGLQLEIVKLPAERALANANAGIEDGDLSRIAGLQAAYPNLVQVPEQAYFIDFMALTLRSDLRDSRWETLRPLRVGFIRGWKIYEQVLPKGIDATSVGDTRQLLSLLKSGRIDVALHSGSMFQPVAEELGIHGLRLLQPPIALQPMYTYLNKRHARHVPCIAEALRAMKREGTYQAICERTLGASAPMACGGSGALATSPPGH